MFATFMALLEKQLVVKKSTIPNSGKGLFTTKPIPKGTLVVEYKGRITVWKEVKDDHDNGYIYTINNQHVIDAKRTKSALARYANDAKGIVRVKGVTNNCVYVNNGKKAFIESVRDIPAGAEILVDYGKDYWGVIRHNLRVDQKKAKAKEKEAQQAKKKKSRK